MITNREQYYYQQVELLLRVLPYVAKESCFALKGGTAINFFIRDMPRLSVDIDLTYLPIESREITLKQIEASLIRIKTSLLNSNSSMVIQEKRTVQDSRLNKLYIHYNNAMIKIEPNEILRGSVYAIEHKNITRKIEETFHMSIIICLSVMCPFYLLRIYMVEKFVPH